MHIGMCKFRVVVKTFGKQTTSQYCGILPALGSVCLGTGATSSAWQVAAGARSAALSGHEPGERESVASAGCSASLHLMLASRLALQGGGVH